MGIRFSCPAGHRLNVKEQLAGRRGKCPVCGAAVQIPQQSATLSDKPADKAAAKTADPAVPRGEAQATAPAPTTPRATPEAAEQTGAAARAPTQASTQPAAPSITETDPISAAGERTWYVRHADGTQYGPAGPEVFRRWVSEGRVGPDSLVWCEGWEQWAVATDVFEELGEHSPVPGNSPAGTVWEAPATQTQPEVIDPEGKASGPVAMQLYWQRRQKTRRRLLTGLILTILILVPLVFWVVFLR